MKRTALGTGMATVLGEPFSVTAMTRARCESLTHCKAGSCRFPLIRIIAVHEKGLPNTSARMCDSSLRSE